MMRENIGEQFDRVAPTAEENQVTGRPSRRELLTFWEEKFGIPNQVFDEYSFWEKGKGTIWIVHNSIESPIRIQALGMRSVRVRQQFWKPTTNAVQRFGGMATKNTVVLSAKDAADFVRGESIEDDVDVDEGYVIVLKSINETPHPIGVGLYMGGEIRSQIPKSRQRTLSD